ncbi:MAG: hypothetical protein M1826_005871 [Phylliscum demangeonii]|nr:MAG: hypothetical protein M1826_005871 [Phylliscum demangeonii]
MDKLKNLVHPGKAKDDEVLYGSGQIDDPVHSGIGTGTGTGTGTSSTASNLGSSSAGTTSTTKGDLVAIVSRDTYNTTGTSGTRGASAIPLLVRPTDGAASSAALNPMVSSTTDPSYSTDTTQHADPLAGNVNKPLPHTPASFTGTPGTGPTLSGALPDRTVGGTGSAGYAGSTPAIAAPHRGQDLTQAGPRYDANGLDIDAAGQRSSPLGARSTLPTGAGPHSSSLGNVLDPRVGSSTGTTRTAAPIVAPHHGQDLTPAGPRYDANGFDLDAPGQRSFPLGAGSTAGTASTGSTQPHHLGRDAALGAGVGAAADGASRGPLHHGHQGLASGTARESSSGHGHGFPAEAGVVKGAIVPGTELRGHYHLPIEPHGAAGTTTAVWTVPGSESSVVGHTAATMAVAGDSSRRDHVAGDAALLAGGVGQPAHDSNLPGSGSHTAGPHQSTLLNKLDPRVDSDQDRSRTISSEPRAGSGVVARETEYPPGAGSTSAAAGTTGVGAYEAEKQHLGSHHGATTAAAAGLGTAGVGAYEAEKHHHGSHHGATTGVGAYEAGKHHLGSHHLGSHHGATTTGAVGSTAVGGYETEKHHHGSHHHTGTAAGLTTAGAGAYEAEKDVHGSHHGASTGATATSTSSGPAGVVSTATPLPRDYVPANREHHYARDATLDSTVAGVGAIDVNRLGHHDYSGHHHGATTGHTHPTTTTTTTTHHTHDTAKEDKHSGHGHGLLGFLHRDKDKHHHDQAATTDPVTDHGHRHGATTTTAGGVGTAAVAEHEDDQHHHERNRLHKDPPQGYAAQVTGGTGTTQLAQGEPVPRGSHLTGAGNELDPAVSKLADRVVTEPHTGLPMDLKSGSGVGGTDGGPMPGYHGRK